MRLHELLIAAGCCFLLLSCSLASGYLLTLDTPSVHAFPFIAPWAAISLPLLAIIPGLALGYFSRQHPFRLAIVLGFSVGLIETTPFYRDVLAVLFGYEASINTISLMSYVAAGVSKAIYLSAFTAAGNLLRRHLHGH